MKLWALTLFWLLFLTGCLEKKGEQAELAHSEKLAITASVDVDLATFLADKLVKLKSDEFTPSKSVPKEYYAFYETASWCGACKKFNSTLLSFYEVYEELYGEKFEVVLLSHDKNEELMRNYAQQNEIRFPHLAFTEKETFAKNVPILTGRLPNLIITDARGRVLKSAFNRTGKYHGPEVAMNYLKSKLEEK